MSSARIRSVRCATMVAVALPVTVVLLAGGCSAAPTTSPGAASTGPVTPTAPASTGAVLPAAQAYTSMRSTPPTWMAWSTHSILTVRSST